MRLCFWARIFAAWLHSKVLVTLASWYCLSLSLSLSCLCSEMTPPINLLCEICCIVWSLWHTLALTRQVPQSLNLTVFCQPSSIFCFRLGTLNDSYIVKVWICASFITRTTEWALFFVLWMPWFSKRNDYSTSSHHCSDSAKRAFLTDELGLANQSPRVWAP